MKKRIEPLFLKRRYRRTALAVQARAERLRVGALNINRSNNREHRKEIVEMDSFKFNQELYDQALRGDGEEIGYEKGYGEGETVGLEKGEAIAEKAREKKATKQLLETAVSEAVEECISENILADFFREHRKEIVEVTVLEFEEELRDHALREEGEAIGFEKGKAIGLEQGIRICQQIQAGNTDNEAIAEESGCAIAEVENIRKQFRF